METLGTYQIDLSKLFSKISIKQVKNPGLTSISKSVRTDTIPDISDIASEDTLYKISKGTSWLSQVIGDKKCELKKYIIFETENLLVIKYRDLKIYYRIFDEVRYYKGENEFYPNNIMIHEFYINKNAILRLVDSKLLNPVEHKKWYSYKEFMDDIIILGPLELLGKTNLSDKFDWYFNLISTYKHMNDPILNGPGLGSKYISYNNLINGIYGSCYIHKFKLTIIIDEDFSRFLENPYKFLKIMNKETLLSLKSENRDNKIISNLISTIIGELDRITKDPSEDQVIKVIKKIYQSNEECLKSSNNDDLVIEQNFLLNYIPRMLDDNTISLIIKDLIEESDNKSLVNLGYVMKYFKSNYPNQYDGGKVKDIFLKLNK